MAALANKHLAKKMARWAIVSATALAVVSCSNMPQGRISPDERAGIEARLLSDISILASEEFAGRRPGTAGEAKTLAFIQQSLTQAGFVSGTNDPANPWRAPVLLINTAATDSRVSITSGKRTVVLPSDNAFAHTLASLGLVEGGEMTFVGRLAEDVPDEQVLGRVVVMLGEPGKSPPRREALFKKGAAAIITVVEDAASVEQVRAFRSQDSFILASDATDHLSVFVTHEAMTAGLGEKQWDALVASADEDGFAPIKLDATASVEARTKRREVTSHNVIGRLAGTNPQAGAVFLMAHWDHFGECGEEGAADRLCNGAVDNASGVAVMLELADRLAASGPHDRDIYILGTTAEEWGLLGAKAFVQTPAVPLDQIAAVLNYDTVAVAPQGSDFVFVGEGETPLDGIVLDTLADQDRTLGNQIMAQQFIRRQDSWAFLEADVPAIVISTNLGSQESLETFLSQRYHQASDEVNGLELGGAIDDVVLNELLLKRLASTTEYPSGGE